MRPSRSRAWPIEPNRSDQIREDSWILSAFANGGRSIRLIDFVSNLEWTSTVVWYLRQESDGGHLILCFSLSDQRDLSLFISMASRFNAPLSSILVISLSPPFSSSLCFPRGGKRNGKRYKYGKRRREIPRFKELQPRCGRTKRKELRPPYGQTWNQELQSYSIRHKIANIIYYEIYLQFRQVKYKFILINQSNRT